MLPTVKQQRNSIRYASAQAHGGGYPQEYAGREDKVTKNKMVVEIQEIPEGRVQSRLGCLPMLIPLPVIFILYYVS